MKATAYYCFSIALLTLHWWTTSIPTCLALSTNVPPNQPQGNNDKYNHNHNHNHLNHDNTYGPVHTLLLCRHGDSIWNGGEPGTRETFTGWTDVPLSPKGIKEAKETGKQLAELYQVGIDVCCTSVLQRAQLTAHYCMWAFGGNHNPNAGPKRYVTDYRLNERHYGALQGLVKKDVENGLHGHDPADVRSWRRSWYAVPPLLPEENNDYDDLRRKEEIRKFQHFCGGAENVPRGESLELVAKQRIRPFLDDVLTPLLDQHGKDGGAGGTGLVVAHANSLRAMIGVLCDIESNPRTRLPKLEALRLQTGVPLVLKYRTRIDNGTYQVCDSNGVPIDNNDDDDFMSDLPVYPLSCIPMTTTTTTSSQPLPTASPVVQQRTNETAIAC